MRTRSYAGRLLCITSNRAEFSVNYELVIVGGDEKSYVRSIAFRTAKKRILTYLHYEMFSKEDIKIISDRYKRFVMGKQAGWNSCSFCEDRFRCLSGDYSWNRMYADLNEILWTPYSN